MKKIFTISILILSINAFAQIPTNGLVGYWPFNGNANDESRNGNNGTVYNATLTTDRFGNNTSAYFFDGSTSYISGTSINLPVGNNPRTISAWFNTNTLNMTTKIIFYWGTCLLNHAYGVSLLKDSILKIRNWGWQNDFDKPFEYSINTWYHVVTTFDGDTTRIYVNGTKLGSNNKQVWNTVQGDFAAGRILLSGYGQTYFSGKIDDIRVYTRALNQKEITLLYTEILSVKETPFSESEINVYPNPTSDMVSIANCKTIRETHVSIVDIQGKILIDNKYQNLSLINIDVSKLIKGIYLLKIQTDNSYEIRKLAIK